MPELHFRLVRLTSFSTRSRLGAGSRKKGFRIRMLLGLLAASTPLLAVPAGVRVVVGATPIPAGDAQTRGDITVINEKLAFAIAVHSAVPYGVPRGAIVDVAPVKDGQIGRDRVVFADFIPNNWSAWPNTYQHVSVVEKGPGQAVIRAVRDWGRATITTVYTLRANSDCIEIRTTMTNAGAVAMPDLLSGLTLWPNSGFVFRVPGLAGLEQGRADGALSDRVVAYDEGWSVTLHAPYLNQVAHGSLDLYQLHTLAPGESRRFEGWLQVGSSGDLAPVLRAEIERKHLSSGAVRGVVTARDGRAVESAVVVVEKQGKPYAWVLSTHGAYELSLPAGDYELYAAGKYYSQSQRTPITVRAGNSDIRDFRDLQSPGRIHFVISDAHDSAPLDARLVITQGQKPLVEFLGRNTFFTELDRKGELEVSIAPGHYLFTVSSGGGFLAPARQVKVDVRPEQTEQARVALSPLFDPPARGWYSADLHHHADQAEAVTPPADLARSQLAAGLNYLFVSDHDSTVNHQPLQQIADRRKVPFIAGIELSPSWGHFNAYPLLPGQKLAIDTSTATISEIFAEARRLGAPVIQANHPLIPYGYFTSVGVSAVPGGFNPEFDLIEINAQAPADDDKVLQKLWGLWNSGHHYYLAAGTDTHDVWNDTSGRLRTFAHIEGDPTPQAFAQALKAGHGYVTYGPLIFPKVVFGDERKVKPGESFVLGFELGSVAGLKSASLVGNGMELVAKSFPDGPRQVHVDFPLQAVHPSWYALRVEDRQGRRAYTDPIWIDVVAGTCCGEPIH